MPPTLVHHVTRQRRRSDCQSSLSFRRDCQKWFAQSSRDCSKQFWNLLINLTNTNSSIITLLEHLSLCRENTKRTTNIYTIQINKQCFAPCCFGTQNTHKLFNSPTEVPERWIHLGLRWGADFSLAGAVIRRAKGVLSSPIIIEGVLFCRKAWDYFNFFLFLWTFLFRFFFEGFKSQLNVEQNSN